MEAKPKSQSARPIVTLRRPRAKERSCWRLLHDWKVVESEQIASINRALMSGELSPDRGEQMARQVMEEYRLKVAPIVPAYLPENEDIATKYVKEVLVLKENRAPEAAIDRMFRAAKSVGKLSIRSAHIRELKSQLGKWDGRPYNDRACALNQLLRFVGRTERLPTKYVPNPEPRYLTLAQFEEVIKHVDDMNFRTLCWAAIGTGARFGELFSLGKIEDGQVYVSTQIKVIRTGKNRQKEFKKAPTKNTKAGWVAIIPEGKKWVERWHGLDWQIKQSYRLNSRLSVVFKNACKKAFPDAPDKWCTFHDLRHSYARYCLENGRSLEDIREWLRDTMTVVERYYLGWGRAKRSGFGS
jgi:integrase